MQMEAGPLLGLKLITSGPLRRRKSIGHEVERPWHRSRFDVTNCEGKHGPATRPEPIFEVKVGDNEILLRPKQ